MAATFEGNVPPLAAQTTLVQRFLNRGDEFRGGYKTVLKLTAKLDGGRPSNLYRDVEVSALEFGLPFSADPVAIFRHGCR